MCNRIRGLKEWSEIPRSLASSLINFEYNPNVAPTEQVPAFLAERGKPLATRMARFGINLASSGSKRRPPFWLTFVKTLVAFTVSSTLAWPVYEFGGSCTNCAWTAYGVTSARPA
jgi:hypothetical protein